MLGPLPFLSPAHFCSLQILRDFQSVSDYTSGHSAGVSEERRVGSERGLAEQGRQGLGPAEALSLFPGSDREEARPGKLKTLLLPTPLPPPTPLQL